MAYYSDIVTDDQTLSARAGVSVTVLDQNGALASLTDNFGVPIVQPLVTGLLGSFSFNAADAVYRLEFRYGGRLVREDEVIVGLPPELVGPAGPSTFPNLQSTNNTTDRLAAVNSLASSTSAFALAAGNYTLSASPNTTNKTIMGFGAKLLGPGYPTAADISVINASGQWLNRASDTGVAVYTNATQLVALPSGAHNRSFESAATLASVLCYDNSTYASDGNGTAAGVEISTRDYVAQDANVFVPPNLALTRTRVWGSNHLMTVGASGAEGTADGAIIGSENRIDNYGTDSPFFQSSTQKFLYSGVAAGNRKLTAGYLFQKGSVAGGAYYGFAAEASACVNFAYAVVQINGTDPQNAIWGVKPSGAMEMKGIATPSAPTTGRANFYVDTDGLLHQQRPGSNKVIGPSPLADVTEYRRSSDPDWTQAFRRAINTGLSVWVPPSDNYYGISDELVVAKRGQRIVGSSNGASRLGLDGSFNMAAQGVVRFTAGCAEGESGISDLEIFCGQNQSAANRSQIIQYPPCVMATDIPRLRFNNTRFSAAWDGFKLMGNCGGLIMSGDIGIGAFGTGIAGGGSIDWWKIDFLSLWPFGISGVSALEAIYYDTNTIGMRAGRIDGLNIHTLNSLGSQLIFENTAGSPGFGGIGNLQMDSRPARIDFGSGTYNVANMYLSGSGPDTYKLSQTEGTLLVGNLWTIGTQDTATDLVQLYGGSLSIDQIVGTSGSTGAAIFRQLGGKARIGDMLVQYGTNTARTNAFLSKTGGTLSLGSLRLPAIGSGSGPAVNITNAAQDDIRILTSNGWAVGLPSDKSQGVYQVGKTIS